MWWAHEKIKIEDGGKIKRMVMVSGLTNSEKLSWMNRLLMIIESEFDLGAQQLEQLPINGNNIINTV